MLWYLYTHGQQGSKLMGYRIRSKGRRRRRRGKMEEEEKEERGGRRNNEISMGYVAGF